MSAHWADGMMGEVVRYETDGNGDVLPPWRALVGVGDYADEPDGGPDLMVTIEAPALVGLEDAVAVITEALEAFAEDRRALLDRLQEARVNGG